MSIPKIIHYCWLSNQKIPPLTRTCINSWKKYLPDFELKLWNINSLDLNKYLFAKEAFEHKKYAFAADFIRIYALYHEGGIYLDGDVLIKKRFDNFLNNDFFSFVEGEAQIQAAFLASVPNHPFLKKMLQYYQNRHFVSPDGSFDTTVLPRILAKEASSFGYINDPIEQHLNENIHIYPIKFCAPNRRKDNPDAIAVHFCDHSWKNKNIFSPITKKVRNHLRALRLKLKA